jgi:hypothetical protein
MWGPVNSPGVGGMSCMTGKGAGVSWICIHRSGIHDNPVVRDIETADLLHDLLRHLLVVVRVRTAAKNESVRFTPDLQVTNPISEPAPENLV